MCETCRVSETTESHQTLSPSRNQEVLEASAQFPLKLLLQKLELESVRREEEAHPVLPNSSEATLHGVSASAQGLDVWSPKYAEAPQSSPVLPSPWKHRREGL